MTENASNSGQGTARPLSESTADSAKPKAYTPKKGRPTPKRDEVERARGIRRGPVSAPETAKEARARRKALKASMTKEEYKEHKRKEREERSRRAKETQAAMDRGDERYLLPRDQGAERRLVRDWVDSKRHINNLVLPLALILLVVLMLGNVYPVLAARLSLVAMIIMLVFFIEGVIIGRGANRIVRERFPETKDHGFGLGFYAYSRASQLRSLRTPKPRVQVGDQV